MRLAMRSVCSVGEADSELGRLWWNSTRNTATSPTPMCMWWSWRGGRDSQACAAQFWIHSSTKQTAEAVLFPTWMVSVCRRGDSGYASESLSVRKSCDSDRPFARRPGCFRWISFRSIAGCGVSAIGADGVHGGWELNGLRDEMITRWRDVHPH